MYRVQCELPFEIFLPNNFGIYIFIFIYLVENEYK